MSDLSEYVAASTDADLEAKLGALFDDGDFHAIHEKISPFNIFEAMGATRAELRHSNFLAYLLSPSRPHGLRSRPLVSILRALLSRLPAAQRPIMALEIIAGEIDDAIVYRERDNIDILIELPSLRFVVAIENKIGAKATKGQLQRYSEVLKSEYPEHRRLLVFLTPDGSNPDHGSFLAYNYTDLADVLHALIAETREPIPDDTRLIIRHYIAMLRRHIVQDERLRTLGLALYERHREAFEFIFECRPEPQSLLTVVRQQIKSVDGLIEDSGTGNSIRFVPAVWDGRLSIIKGDPMKWTKSGRGLLFEAKAYSSMSGRVNVSLILGPGDTEMRTRVYQAAAAQPTLFTGLVKPMGTQWATIFSRDLLTSAQAKNLTFEAQSSNVQFAWSDFQSQKLQQLTDAVLAIDKQLTASSESG